MLLPSSFLPKNFSLHIMYFPKLTELFCCKWNPAYKCMAKEIKDKFNTDDVKRRIPIYFSGIKM